MNHLAFHIHHDELAEYIHHEEGALEARERYIRNRKSCALKRIRLMKEIPDELLPADVLAAAKEVRLMVERNNYVLMVDAQRVLNDVIRNSKEFGVLHQELCPACPWNGETIFTPEDDEVEQVGAQ